jgi:rubrerythrin
MEVTTIRLDQETLDALQDEADELGITRAEYIRQILARRDPPNTRENTQPNTDGETLDCHNCGYSWTYEGDLPRATCPGCGTKVWVDDD